MREVTIGDFVETIHDINGILTVVKKGLLWFNCLYCNR